jgi:Nuclease-related domain
VHRRGVRAARTSSRSGGNDPYASLTLVCYAVSVGDVAPRPSTGRCSPSGCHAGVASRLRPLQPSILSLSQAIQRQLHRTANQDHLAQSIAARFHDLVIKPVAQFFLHLDQGERTVLYVLLGGAAVLGFLIGRRWAVRTKRRRTFPAFQNRGEALVSRVLLSNFHPPDYHLMNHVTIRLEDGTTEVDHILVSRFGVCVLETKDYSGWIFANAADRTWTQVRFKWRSRFQNPIFQNNRHVGAVRELLDFLPPGAVQSIVVFSGGSEFKAETPEGVIEIGQLTEYLRQ